MWRQWGLTVVALPCLSRRFYLPTYSQHVIRQLVSRADVVNLMSHWTLINVLAYRAAKQLGKPYTVCPAGTLPIFGRSKVLKGLYNHLMGRKVVRDADGWIAISRNEIEQFESYGVHSKRVAVIPNGINPSDFSDTDGMEFRRRYCIGGSPVILFVGRLNIIKGPDMLLEAFLRCRQDDRMKRYHLVFAGPDGGMLNALERKVRHTGTGERIHFIGHIGHDERSDAYRAADFLAIPSRQEAMSIVVLEAGISGTPVLVTDRCGFDDVAAVGGGMVVEASVEGLQGGLLGMTGNPAQLKVMGDNLERFTRGQFHWDIMVKRYLELFSQIIR
jgi:glycosyltransferase involved in cell wall biosynthesis